MAGAARYLCPKAERTLDAVVPIPGTGDSWDEFIACMRGPGTPQIERQVRALLRTVRFAPPPPRSISHP